MVTFCDGAIKCQRCWRSGMPMPCWFKSLHPRVMNSFLNLPSPEIAPRCRWWLLPLATWGLESLESKIIRVFQWFRCWERIPNRALLSAVRKRCLLKVCSKRTYGLEQCDPVPAWRVEDVRGVDALSFTGAMANLLGTVLLVLRWNALNIICFDLNIYYHCFRSPILVIRLDKRSQPSPHKQFPSYPHEWLL